MFPYRGLSRFLGRGNIFRYANNEKAFEMAKFLRLLVIKVTRRVLRDRRAIAILEALSSLSLAEVK